jgi:hypothetical protein
MRGQSAFRGVAAPPLHPAPYERSVYRAVRLAKAFRYLKIGQPKPGKLGVVQRDVKSSLPARSARVLEPTLWPVLR